MMMVTGYLPGSVEHGSISHRETAVDENQSGRTNTTVDRWERRSHLAYTLDVSEHGVRLGGFRGELKVGDKIEIQYHHTRAQFRVVWITAREGSSERQIGAECVEPEKQLWGVEFPEERDEYEEEE